MAILVHVYQYCNSYRCCSFGRHCPIMAHYMPFRLVDKPVSNTNVVRTVRFMCTYGRTYSSVACCLHSLLLSTGCRVSPWWGGEKGKPHTHTGHSRCTQRAASTTRSRAGTTSHTYLGIALRIRGRACIRVRPRTYEYTYHTSSNGSQCIQQGS
jgi:hypothetical protein